MDIQPGLALYGRYLSLDVRSVLLPNHNNADHRVSRRRPTLLLLGLFPVISIPHYIIRFPSKLLEFEGVFVCVRYAKEAMSRRRSGAQVKFIKATTNRQYKQCALNEKLFFQVIAS